MSDLDNGVSASLQDYLEVILSLSERGEPVRVTDIASELNIAKASVTQALGVLKKQELVYQDRYGPVRLTDKGRRCAANVYKRHRVIRYFLSQILGVEPDIAEKDACSLEHVVSHQTFKKMNLFLENRGVYFSPEGEPWL